MNNYSILKDLEDFLIYEKIEKIKLEFIQEHYENIDVIVCDHDFGLLTVNPDSSENEFATISFEKEYLCPQLYRKTQELKNNVDKILIELISKEQQINFIRYLNNTIEFIRKRQEKLFSKFPICKKPFATIEKYLSDKYHIDLVSKQQINIQPSIFKVKPNIKRYIFKELYDLAIELEIVDDELISEIEFISTLTEYKTNNTITFNCDNNVMICFLESISPLFYNLNSTSIAESKRFYTKQGKQITSSIYYTSKNRLKNSSDKETIKEIVLNIDKLIKSTFI
ncbi:hypothetical protein [Dysgonomonas sp. GY617]|uniref:hypothetical protein n=1 Tax=Dysgonomonas sp. GY617 TaxID=2780420 RepID=UPI001883BBD0|nr:hypothetical protein [Dysgonomonas sp. GY617]MBF0576379.1 hypothetical protein [Dysgonomonas sp. GY617]